MQTRVLEIAPNKLVPSAANVRWTYLLRGPARAEWEYSLPEVEALRYSITFRTMRTLGPDVTPLGG